MLAKRLTAIGGLLLAFLLLVLGNQDQDYADAYFFPNMITYFLVVFAAGLLISEGKLLEGLKNTVDFLWRWFFGTVGENNPSRWPDIVRLIPMFIIILAYLYFAETVGLYSTSFIAFLAIVVVYTPHRPRSKTLFKNLFISAAFMGAIYLIFSVLLQLQTPSALLL